MNEHKIKLNLRNFKKIKELNIILEDDSFVYLVKGKNDIGKSSVGQSLLALLTINNFIPDIVMHGEDVATAEMEIPMPLGTYHVKMTATKESTSFTMFDPTGAKISRVTDMRNIIQYNAMTVDDFVKKSYSTAGRREQIKILSNLLDPIDAAAFNGALSDVDTKKGKLFLKRKETKNKVDASKQLLEALSYTNEEKKFYEENNRAEEYLESLENRISIAQKVPSKETELRMLANSFESSMEVIEKAIEGKENSINYNEERIQKLLEEVNTLKVANSELSNYKLELIEKRDKTIEEYDKNKKATENRTEDIEDIEELQSEARTVRETITKVNTIGNKISKYSMQKAIYEEDFKAYTTAEATLKASRDTLLELIKKIDIPGMNLEIKEDTIYIDGYALDENQIADSKLILSISAILAKVNHKSPVLVVGKLRELDNDSLAKLEVIARENNCKIIGDYVENDIQNLVVEAFIADEGIKDLPITKTPKETVKENTNLNEI